MVKETVTHLIKMHGADEVRKWKFEAWKCAHGRKNKNKRILQPYIYVSYAPADV